MTTNLYNLWNGLNDVEVLTGPPRRLGLPPADLARRSDSRLGDLITQYDTALADHAEIRSPRSRTRPGRTASLTSGDDAPTANSSLRDVS